MTPPAALLATLQSWGWNAEIMQLAAEGWGITLAGVKLGQAMRSLRGVSTHQVGNSISVEVAGAERPHTFTVPVAALTDDRALSTWLGELKAQAEANLEEVRARDVAAWQAGNCMSGMSASTAT